MNLIFDIIIWIVLWIYLFNKKYISDILSIIFTIFLYIIIKWVLLWIILWFFWIYFPNNIIYCSFIINIVFFIFLLINYKNLKIEKISYNFSYLHIILVLFIFFTSILIYNVIPFWGDELMYHLPISVELLQKWSWLKNLGLTSYWHNDIWQWYPKNLYFVIDYFFANIKSILGIQSYWAFAFGFFCLSVSKIIIYFLKKNDIKNSTLSFFTLLLVVTTPVIFLHVFVKVDILFFSFVILFIYNLFIFSNIYFLFLLFFLIVGFKIIWIYLLWIIWIAYLLYLLIFDRNKFKEIFTQIYKNKFSISLFIVFCWIFLYSFIFNFFEYGNLLYPINVINFDYSQSANIFFWLQSYVKDLIFSSDLNYELMKTWVNSFIFDYTYNYNRGVWFVWIFILFWLIFYFLLKKNRRLKEINYFAILLLFTFCVISFNRLNLLFWHRYQIFIYVLLIIVSVIVFYEILNKKLLYFLLLGMIGTNIYFSYPYIWSFTKKWSWNSQIKIFTKKNFCNKIDYLWDLARDDYRRWWKYVCENIQNTNILLINQVFNFYLYWKDFDNKLYNKIFFNKKSFSDFISKKNISYIITSNKNNLYSKFGVEKDYFYVSSHDSNDESILFCLNERIKNVSKIELDYVIDDAENINVNFWINNLSENKILKWKHTVFVPKTKYINNLCVSISDTPKTSLSNTIKKIRFSTMNIVKKNWKRIKILPKYFSFRDYAIEDVWLKELWYKKIFIDNFMNLDYMFIWGKDKKWGKYGFF